MRIFFSVGEPSGDIHGANLIRCLRQARPNLECMGFGGDEMAHEGCQLLFPLTQLAVMGLSHVLASLPQFLGLISQADRYFRHHRPDAVVLIDYPGFNWWIARRAHFHGIPVYYFVPPQLWAWASWRVKKMRQWSITFFVRCRSRKIGIGSVASPRSTSATPSSMSFPIKSWTGSFWMSAQPGRNHYRPVAWLANHGSGAEFPLAIASGGTDSS